MKRLNSILHNIYVLKKQAQTENIRNIPADESDNKITAWFNNEDEEATKNRKEQDKVKEEHKKTVDEEKEEARQAQMNEFYRQQRAQYEPQTKEITDRYNNLRYRSLHRIVLDQILHPTHTRIRHHIHYMHFYKLYVA